MTKGELAKVTTMWRQAHFGAVMYGSLQLTHTSSDKTGMEEEVGHSSPKGDPMEVRKFCPNDVRGLVCTTQKVNIPPFNTVSVHANSSVKRHCMCRITCTHGIKCQVPSWPAAVVLNSGNLWRVASRILKGTYLTVQLECPYHGNSHKGHGWTGYPCQPSATGSPPNQEFWRVKPHTPKGMGLGGPGPPRSPRMARIRAEAGQRITGPSGSTCFHTVTWTYVKLLWSNTNRGDRSDTLQRALLMYTSPHVQWCEGPYPWDAGYWCYPKVTQSMG